MERMDGERGSLPLLPVSVTISVSLGFSLGYGGKKRKEGRNEGGKEGGGQAAPINLHVKSADLYLFAKWSGSL